MKIVIDARIWGSKGLGIGRYTQKLIENLIISDSSNSYTLLVLPSEKNLILPTNFELAVVNARPYSFREQFEVYRVLKRLKPDIFHALHTNVPLFYSGKLLLTIHDLTSLTINPKASNLPTALYYLKAIVYRFIVQMSVKKAISIVVPSNSVKQQVINNYKVNDGKINVIYEGVDSVSESSNSDFLRSNNIRKPYLMYVGSSYPHKNLKVLIEATIKVNLTINSNLQTIIVTPNNIFRQKMIKDLMLGDITQSVRFFAHLSDPDLTTLYRNSLAFVFPSLSEGVGLPGLEAMKAGTVVLASDIEVFREIYQDNALYFDPHNVLSLVKAINQISDMRVNQRVQKIAKAKKFVSKYSWLNMAKGILDIYKIIDRSKTGTLL